jgi:hypothetical protein
VELLSEREKDGCWLVDPDQRGDCCAKVYNARQVPTVNVHRPEPAPKAGLYEELNIFGTPTERAVRVEETSKRERHSRSRRSDSLGGILTGDDPISDFADLLRQAAHARQLAEVLTDAVVASSLISIATEFAALVVGQPPPDSGLGDGGDAAHHSIPRRIPYFRARCDHKAEAGRTLWRAVATPRQITFRPHTPIFRQRPFAGPLGRPAAAPRAAARPGYPPLWRSPPCREIPRPACEVARP